MKKSKKLISLLLVVMMVLSSLAVGFTAFAADEETIDPAIQETMTAIDAFEKNKSYLFSSNADKKAEAERTYNEAAAKLKGLTTAQREELDIKYFAFFLYYAEEVVGRRETAGTTNLTSTAAKVYGCTTAFDKLEAEVGEFPKDYKAAMETMRKVYTRLDKEDKKSFFGTSFDFQKYNDGYAHFDAVMPEIAKLSEKALEFVDYLSPSDDAFYIYGLTTTSEQSYLINTLSKIAFNYYQDKAGVDSPQSVSFYTFTSGYGDNRVWKDGESGATYKKAMEDYRTAYMNNHAVHAVSAYSYLANLFGKAYGKDFENAAKLAYDTGIKYFNGNAVTVDEINAVSAAVEKVADDSAKDVLNRLMASSNLYVAVGLTYKLDPSEYDDTISAPDAYSNQISASTKSVQTLVNDLQNVIQQLMLEDFTDYVNKVDISKLTDEIAKEAVDKYYAMSGDYQKKVDETTKAKLVEIATKKLVDAINAVDMDNITVADQQATYEIYVGVNGEFRDTMADDVKAKYTAIQQPIKDMSDLKEEIAAFETTEIVRPENSEVAWTTGGIQSAVDGLWEMALSLLPLIPNVDIDLSEGLDPILKDNLYQASVVEAIFDLYAMLIQDQSQIDVGMGGMTFPLGTIISWIVTTDKIADFLAADGTKYAGAAEKIRAVEGADKIEKVVKLADVTFTAEDFGFKAGDRDGFADALLAVLRPITTLLAPGATIKAMGFLDVATNISMFDYMAGDGSAYVDGVYASLLPLLETIGMKNLPTEAEYKANYEKVKETSGNDGIAADEFLRPIIAHLFTDVVDVVSPDPLNGLIKVLPRIAQVLRPIEIPAAEEGAEPTYTSALNNAVKKAANSLGVLSGALGGLDLSPAFFDNLITQDIDLAGIIGSEEPVVIKLSKIDWAKLADCATVDAVESSSNYNAYNMIRTGEVDSAFTTVFYYLYDNVIGNDANYKVVTNLLKSLGGIGDTVLDIVAPLKEAGKIDAYGLVLDELGEPTGDVIEKPTEPVEPTDPTDPENPTDPTDPVKPTDPTKPVEPTKPGTDEPTKVTKPNVDVKDPSIPKTGAQKAAASVAAVAGSVAVLGALIIAKKKKISE